MITVQPVLHPEGKAPSFETLLHLMIGIIDPVIDVVHLLCLSSLVATHQ